MKVIGYVNIKTEKAQKILSEFIRKYDLIDVEKETWAHIDVLLVFGGDGFMLHNIHKFQDKKIPIYGINCGSVGFLLNSYDKNADLNKVIDNAHSTRLTPLNVQAIDCHDAIYRMIAINEVSIFRKDYRSIFIQITINGLIRVEKLVGDGLLISTATGSTAYNFAAGGPILPINSQSIVLTGINVFRPRRWKSALLPDNVKINLKIIDSEIRPVIVASDHNKVTDIKEIEIFADVNNSVELLFDSKDTLAERRITEQFLC